VKFLETDRLLLRQLTTDDAPFILELLNEPSFLQNIGDKGVRSITDARGYLLSGPLASYEHYGFGLYLVERKESRVALGICGLLKRETLADVDLGFAFLPQFWGQGFAVEAAQAVKNYAHQRLGLERIAAITLPSNRGSIRVLEALGMRFEKRIRLAEEAEELMLFEYEFAALGERA
jgi:RimJ/RimL family protein N-acetyltransferase